jgi:hypothetical protein
VANTALVAGIRNGGQNIKQAKGSRHGEASYVETGFASLPPTVFSAKLNY